MAKETAPYYTKQESPIHFGGWGSLPFSSVASGATLLELLRLLHRGGSRGP